MAMTGAQRAPEPEPGPAAIGIRRFAPLILLFAALVGACAGLLAGTRDDRFEATSQILFRPAGVEIGLLAGQVEAGPAGERDIANGAALLRSRTVAAEAARRVDRAAEEAEVADAVDIRLAEEADFVTVAATAPSSAEAVDLANAYADAFKDLQTEEQARRARAAREVLAARLRVLPESTREGLEGQGLRARVSQLRALERVGTGSPQVIERARASQVTELGAPVTLAVVLGVIGGLVLGVGAAAWRVASDRRVRGERGLREAFGAPVLGVVPASRPIRDGDAIGELPAGDLDAFRTLAAKLISRRPPRSVLVTGAEQGAGASTVAWYLACTVAASGQRVALVEAAPSRPSPPHGVPPGAGFAEVVSGEASLNDVIRSVPAGVDGGEAVVEVLTAGARDRFAGVRPPAGVGNLMDDLLERYDLVVVDGAPVALPADLLPFSGRVDAALVVARVGVTRTDAARRARRELDGLDLPLVGVVANGAKASSVLGPGDGDALSHGRGRAALFLGALALLTVLAASVALGEGGDAAERDAGRPEPARAVADPAGAVLETATFAARLLDVDVVRAETATGLRARRMRVQLTIRLRNVGSEPLDPVDDLETYLSVDGRRLFADRAAIRQPGALGAGGPIAEGDVRTGVVRFEASGETTGLLEEQGGADLGLRRTDASDGVERVGVIPFRSAALAPAGTR